MATNSNNKNNIEIPSRPKPSTDIKEIESAECECCGMCEECTEEYIIGMREMFSGRLVCGICAASVSREMEKNGGNKNEALEKHMNYCVKFNKFGRSYPALYQAEAVKEILKKSSTKKGTILIGPNNFGIVTTQKVEGTYDADLGKS